MAAMVSPSLGGLRVLALGAETSFELNKSFLHSRIR